MLSIQNVNNLNPQETYQTIFYLKSNEFKHRFITLIFKYKDVSTIDSDNFF